MKRSLLGLLLLSHSCFSFAVTPPPPGCKKFTQVNSNLQNDQIFRFPGGSCGGEISITVNFSGKEQFVNGDGSQNPKASIFIYRSDKPAINMCSGQPWKDEHFNTFSLSCMIKEAVAPNVSLEYVAKYSTDNVSDNPLPQFTTSISYTPKLRHK